MYPQSTDQNHTSTGQGFPVSGESEQNPLSTSAALEPNTLIPWVERAGHVLSVLEKLQEERSGWVAQLNMLDEAGISTGAIREGVDAHLEKEANIRTLLRNNLEVLDRFGELPAASLKEIGLDAHVSQMMFSLQSGASELHDEQQALEIMLHPK